MSKRKPANPSYDKSHFTRTATSTKAINLSAINFRGGIRL